MSQSLMTIIYISWHKDRLGIYTYIEETIERKEANTNTYINKKLTTTSQNKLTLVIILNALVRTISDFNLLNNAQASFSRVLSRRCRSSVSHLGCNSFFARSSPSVSSSCAEVSTRPNSNHGQRGTLGLSEGGRSTAERRRRRRE
jgi:hypothetical protein